ncbi:hypothetical protein DJ524_10370 [Sulfolobus sp. D5]|nr:hypothetical protein DJ524_10370 [Sulfolobus sp. D5]
MDDYAIAYIKLEKDISFVLEVGWAGNVSHVEERGYIRILGDEGGLEGIGNEAIVDISYHSRTENFLVDTKPHLGKVDLPFEMVKSFVKSIMENRVPQLLDMRALYSIQLLTQYINPLRKIEK